GDQNQQMQQLLQAMINTLNQPWEPQVKNSEQNLANIPTFTGGNQDPVEWLEAIDRAFKANKIVGAKRLFVVSAYLTGLAASWWENRRNQEPRILIWMKFRITYSPSTNRRVREPAQMFVQGLRPDLSLAVGPVMLNTIQEAIEKARMCELTFAHSVAACDLCYRCPVVSAPTTPNQMEQMVSLMREVVSVVKGGRRSGNNRPCPPKTKIDKEELTSHQPVSLDNSKGTTVGIVQM
ncbi:2259_t:CDS:2, partial [Gigaspora rosea]